MCDKRLKALYKQKEYINKAKRAKSRKYSNKGRNNIKIIDQSADPDKINNPSVYDAYINFNIPYYGWNLFFCNEEYDNESDTVKKIKTVENYINRHQHLLSSLTLEYLENGSAFTFDVCELCNDKSFLNEWSDFKQNLYENPLYTLNCFKLAVHQNILHTISQKNIKCSMIIVNTASGIRLKLLNCQPILCFQDLKASSYGTLVSIRGCVIRVSHVKHLAHWIVFLCCKCHLQSIVRQPHGIYTVPKKCKACGKSKFYPMLDSPQIQSMYFQKIRVQELQNDEQSNKGMMPRILDIELMDNLVNNCMPGDDITLTGIMKGTNNSNTKKRKRVPFSLYMEAITIINNKQKLQSQNIMDNEMSIKDYLAIKEIYNTRNIFPLLVHSLCPSIYGHEMIKAGLILSLFGGNTEHIEIRDNIHTLVVGDPGLGKSQMLQACARIAAKGVYVCGNSSTSSGLTITLTKENKSNNFALEPGALVVADKGCCCIDEFDKMSKQHAALLESMEQQRVSVAKSGVICSLPTRTSILAAANPIKGRFNRRKTVMQNLNMSPPLLSRFDLVFLLLDEPNEHIDDLLCQHVMSVHKGSNKINSIQSNIWQASKILETTKTSSESKFVLRDRLTSSVAESTNLISQSILRKYISYARQYVKPILTKKAAIVLKNYYLNLRSKQKCSDLSVYNRQLEAMIRLTKARAKLELRTEATDMDALDVVEILQCTMTETNKFNNNFVGLQSLKKKKTNSKVRKFITLLRKETFFDKNKILSTKRLHEIALNGKILVPDFSDFLSKLNENGILLKTGRNTFKVVTHSSDCKYKNLNTPSLRHLMYTFNTI